VSRNWKSIAVVAIGVPLVTAVGIYRLSSMSEASIDVSSLDSIVGNGSTTSTSTNIRLNDRAYRAGDCVTWDQTEGRQAIRSTKVVSCDEPHLFEFVSKVQLLRNGEYPSTTEWTEIFQEQCGPVVNQYLGYALDHLGRFYVSAIHPSEEDWSQTIFRDLQCGIGYRSSPAVSSDDPVAAFTGRAKGQDQTLLYPVGTCISYPAAGEGQQVPCSEVHDVEVVGYIELTGDKHPASLEQWREATPGCATVARSYVGGNLSTKGLEWSHLPLQVSSWEAGRRTVECTVAKYDSAGNTVDVTGSAKA
jgi:hypothetical protein